MSAAEKSSMIGCLGFLFLLIFLICKLHTEILTFMTVVAAVLVAVGFYFFKIRPASNAPGKEARLPHLPKQHRRLPAAKKQFLPLRCRKYKVHPTHNRSETLQTKQLNTIPSEALTDAPADVAVEASRVTRAG